MKSTASSKIGIALLLACSLGMAGCSPNSINLLNAIVSSAELIIPLIPNIPPADAALITTYVGSAMTITDNMTTCGGMTATCIAVAVRDFQTLILPSLSPAVPANYVAFINGLAGAITNFLKAYQPAPAAMIRAGKLPKEKALSASDQAKLAELHARIQEDKIKLAGKGKV